ncbi:hypothetical protein Q5752_002466 [Cryptotrichosporon argae]
MWRPATKTSGTNDVPLGNTRRFGLPEEPSAPPPPSAAPAYGKPPADIQFFNGRVDRDRAREDRDRPRDPRDDRYDRPRDDYRDDKPRDYGYDRDGRGGADRAGDGERKRSRWDDERAPEVKQERGRDTAPVDEAPRKRKTRWGDANDRVEVAGLPVNLTGKVSGAELDNYAIHVRLEEINRKLRVGDVVPADGRRSPSPPPKFDAYGRRTNTRELRYRDRLEEERNRLIDRAMKNDPNFRPPMDVQNARRGVKPMDKVYIPVKEFPEINFFGLLVGPRGNSLKRMERESGAKISIRGKGSVKEGKGRPEAFAHDEDDELHCVITGDTEMQVKHCVTLINKVIETAASTPEGQNDHKRNQLRELASLNGTLRDDENQLCQNCGEKGHRRWECPQQRQYSANVICRLCGGAGHMARDCRGRGDPNMAKPDVAFDSEYSALMAELGQDAANTSMSAAAQQQSQIPPWRIPENWQGGFRQQNPGFGGGYNQGPGGFQQDHYNYGPNGGQGHYNQQDQFEGGAESYAAYYAQLGQAAPAVPV